MATFTIEEVLNNPMMNYDNEPNCNIDWSMMTYNDWKTPEYWASKYPAGLVDEYPGLWQHFEHLAENAKSPLEEWQERQPKEDKKESK